MISGLVEEGGITLTEQLESVSLPSFSAEAVSDLSAETPSDSGKAYQAGERGKTPFTMPKYDLSPQSGTGNTGTRLKVSLARLKLEAHEQEMQSQLQLKLEIRKAELQAETEKAVRLRQLGLEASETGRSAPRGSGMSPPSTTSTSSPKMVFDISKHVALVPVFRDNEVDSYFNVFERIAAALQWPPKIWTLLLQCKMHGKAIGHAIVALPVEDRLNYETVKTAIL